jgi:signal transduction histidine kinase
MATAHVYNERDKYSMQLVNIIRLTGLFIPFLLIGYGALALFEFIDRSPAFTLTAFIILSVIFTIIAFVEYSIPRSLYEKAIPWFLLIYGALGSSFIIWVSGFESPITFCWVILMVVIDLYYGRNWFYICALALGLTSVGAFMVTPDATLPLLITYFTLAVFISVIGYIMSALRQIQRVEHKDLQRTKRQQIVQQEQLMTLINSINVAMMSTTPNGVIRVYNAALLSLLDTNDSLSGKSIDDVLNTFTVDGEPLKLSTLTSAAHRMDRDDIMLRYDDGEEIRLSIGMSPIQGTFAQGTGAVEGFIFLLQDITKAKSLEEERDEFISVISHELRTPITIAEGTISNAKLFLERGTAPAKLVPSLVEAHEQVTFLANMVNDLGTLSRAERGVGDAFEEIDLKELATEMYHKYQPRAHAKKLTFHLDTGTKLGTITTSRLYLEEMLQNFITNAIKYTQKGSVTLTIKRNKDGGVLFAVKDSGIGMNKTDLGHIFEKFYRSEDYRTRETSGTGLGLYVVSKLAHKLGVKVEVSSRLNHGSTFSFVHREAKTKTVAHTAPDTGASKPA